MTQIRQDSKFSKFRCQESSATKSCWYLGSMKQNFPFIHFLFQIVLKTSQCRISLLMTSHLYLSRECRIPSLFSFTLKVKLWTIFGFFTSPGNYVSIHGLKFEYIWQMVPDIEWGKNIHVILEIGCTYASLGAFLLEKDVITLSLGLKDDLVDLAQVALERGFPTVVSPFRSRRLPFPSGVFDAIHCGGCSRSWHSNGLSILPCPS